MAKSLYTNHEIMTINEACGAVDSEHMLAGHCDKAQMFLDYHNKKFNSRPTIHATYRKGFVMPECVDYWWSNCATGGTSAWKAILIGRAMGFKEFVLCGCPMTLTGYFNPADTKGFKHECKRVGEPLPDGNISQLTRRYRDEFVRNVEGYKLDIKSMSGWTREVLGG